MLGNLRRWYYTFSGTLERTQSYKIDGRNRRIARMIVSGSTSTLDHGWLYDGDRVIGEVDSAGNALSHFAYVTRSNVPDLMLQKVSGTWTLYRIISDQVGTVKAIVQVSNGAVTQTLTYQDVWGSIYGTQKSPFGFAGGVFESYPLTYRFGARDYNPFQRRWLSKDRSRFAGGHDFYVYCANDPVNCIDPTGKWTVSLGGNVGFFLGVVGPGLELWNYGGYAEAGFVLDPSAADVAFYVQAAHNTVGLGAGGGAGLSVTIMKGGIADFEGDGREFSAETPEAPWGANAQLECGAAGSPDEHHITGAAAGGGVGWGLGEFDRLDTTTIVIGKPAHVPVNQDALNSGSVYYDF